MNNMTKETWLSSVNPLEMLDSIESENPSNRKLRLLLCACIRRTWSWFSERMSVYNILEFVEDIIDGSYIVVDETHFNWYTNLLLSTNGFKACNEYFDEMYVLGNYSSLGIISIGCQYLRDIFNNPFEPLRYEWINKELYEVFSVNYGMQIGLEIDRNPVRWMNSEVRSLALAAYNERDEKRCEKCIGFGFLRANPYDRSDKVKCETCKGVGKLDNSGCLDKVRLNILADCLEDHGCEDQELLVPLRGYIKLATKDMYNNDVYVEADTERFRGFWPLDLLLNKE
jgi:hypothetical protein